MRWLRRRLFRAVVGRHVLLAEVLDGIGDRGTVEETAALMLGQVDLGDEHMIVIALPYGMR